jgi:hypothetical protein
MMTQYNFEAAALLIKEFEKHFGQEGIDDVIDLFVRFFREDNSRFDERRFRAACQTKG